MLAQEGEDRAPLLVINLVKSKKGYTAAVHKYLLRFEVMKHDGTTKWEYVYPAGEQIESYDPHAGLKLKPGVTAASIINEFFFGSYGVDEKTGEPWVKNGYFYDYKPVLDTKATLYKPHKDPIDTAKLGKYRFYKFKRSPGYVSIEPGNGMSKNYEFSNKVKELHLTDEKDIQHAQNVAPGAGIAAGKVPISDEQWKAKTEGTTPDTGKGSIWSTNVQSIDSATALLSPATKAEDYPQWAIDKFGSAAKLQDELRTRPVTTKITLGIFDPKDKKQQQDLYNEWAGTIRNIAKKKADAYKVTNTYSAWEKMDEDQGYEYTSPNSHRWEFLKQVTNELTADGMESLWQNAVYYQGKPHDQHDRFDKFAFTAINNHIADVSRKQAIADGAELAIAHEQDEDELARKQGSQHPLSPEEAYELKEYSGPARAALMRVLNDPTMPETYRRVFTSRLWMDDLNEEAASIYGKKEAHEKAHGGGWMRPFIGKDSILSKYKEWNDPTTGEPVSFQDMGETKQRSTMNQWFSDAQSQILSQFSAKRDGKRQLTHEGRVVKRWLELETKLATQNRRTFTQREMHDVKYEHIPAPNTKPLKTEALMQHPAVEFFNQSQNQKLAQDLHLNFAKLKEQGHYEPGITIGTQAQTILDTASKHHKMLQDRATWTNAEIKAKQKNLHGFLTSLKDAGGWEPGPFGSSQWTEGSVTKFHDAAVKFQGHVLEQEGNKKAAKKLHVEYAAVGKKPPEHKLEPLKTTPAQEEAATKAHAHMVEAAKRVGIVAPEMVSDYATMLKKNIVIEADHMASHKAALTTKAHAARAELTLLQFEKDRRKVGKSLKGTVDDLRKALLDYDFEIQRLRASVI